MFTHYPFLYNRKKDLLGKKIRVIIWGRNEYDGSVTCNAKTYQFNDNDPSFYFEDGKIHFHHKPSDPSFRYFKDMSRHYVFDWRGECVSHQQKKYIAIDTNGKRFCAPYAEIKIIE